MFHRRLFDAAILVISAFLVVGCVNEEDFDTSRLTSKTINPTIEANLLTMNFTAKDLFNQIADSAEGVSILYAGGEDDSVIVEIEKNFELSAQDLSKEYFNQEMEIETYNMSIPDFTVPTVPSGYTWNADYIVCENENAKVEIPTFAKSDPSETDRIIDSVVLSSGSLSLAVNSRIPYDMDITLHSNSLLDASHTPFSRVYNISSNGSSTMHIDLANHTLHFSHNATNDTSYLDFYYTVKVKCNGQSYSPGTYGVDFSIQGTAMNIDLAYGKVGNPTIETTDTIDLKYFDDSLIRANMVDAEKIDMIFDIINYTGIGVDMDVTNCHTLKFGTRQNLFSESTIRRIGDASVPGGTFSVRHVLHPNTSSIENLPDKFVYDLKYSFDDGVNYAFIHPSKKYLDIHSVVRIPVIVSVDSFTSDMATSDLDFIRDEDAIGDYIDSAMLKLNFVNTFPADLMLGVYVVDTITGVRTDILDRQVKVAAANIDAQGRVVSARNSSANPVISKEKYQKLRSAHKVMFRMTLYTANIASGTRVHFRSDNNLGVKMGIKAYTSIEF